MLIEFTLPALPDMKNLSGNARRRLHWQAQQKATLNDKARWYALLEPQARALLSEFPDAFPIEHVDIFLRVQFPDKRARDHDNVSAALKPLLDVLCSARGKADGTWRLGLIEDDSNKCVRDKTLKLLSGSEPETYVAIMDNGRE